MFNKCPYEERNLLLNPIGDEDLIPKSAKDLERWRYLGVHLRVGFQNLGKLDEVRALTLVD